MSLTLGTLRTFCAEQASPDSAGASADREFMVWINGALYRLYGVADWDRNLFEKKITVPPRESGSDLNVTQGSAAITRDTDFDAKYLSDRWALCVPTQPRVEFEIDSIGAVGSHAATLRTGDEWIDATATDLDYYFALNKIALSDVKKVVRVQVLNTATDVVVVTPEKFDYIKATSPIYVGSFPTVCTFRRGRLELWPHPGDSYAKLSITYMRTFTPLTTSDVDGTVIEWDENLRHVLEKAILLEASIYQGEDAVVPYQTALNEYLQALAVEIAHAEKDDMTGPMGLRSPIVGPSRTIHSVIGEITDA